MGKSPNTPPLNLTLTRTVTVTVTLTVTLTLILTLTVTLTLTLIVTLTVDLPQVDPDDIKAGLLGENFDLCCKLAFRAIKQASQLSDSHGGP